MSRGFGWMLAGVLLWAPAASAGGFYIPEQGAAAMGMGNAYAAVSDDATAVWHNPAALAFGEGTTISLGGELILPDHEYTPAGGATYGTRSETHLLPHLYAAHRPHGAGFAFGVGVNAPFGLSTDWRGSGAPFAQPAAGAASVTLSEIRMMQVNPAAALKLGERLAVALGAVYARVDRVNLDSRILLLSGDGDGWGVNAALFYDGEAFDLGLSYRSRVKIDIAGSGAGTGALAAAGATPATTSITLPDIVNAGVAFHPARAWLVSLQIDWVNWKTFDSVDVSLVPSPLTVALGSGTVSIPENWRAATTLRAGAVWHYRPDMRARIGYVYNTTPVTDRDFSPRLPGNDRQLFTVGYGHDFTDAATVDLAYAYVLLRDRNQTGSATALYDGRYRSRNHLLALTYTHRF